MTHYTSINRSTVSRRRTGLPLSQLGEVVEVQGVLASSEVQEQPASSAILGWDREADATRQAPFCRIAASLQSQ